MKEKLPFKQMKNCWVHVANGEAIGTFKDAAMDEYLKANVIPYTVEQFKDLIMEGQCYYAELGYTAYVEVFVESDAFML